MDMDTTGFESLFNKVSGLTDTYEMKRAALNKEGKIFKIGMEEEAPVNENRKQGKHLKDTIRKRVIDEYGDLSVEITPSKFYKGFINWGWGSSKVPPNPFIYRAYENKKDEAIETAKREVLKHIARHL